MNEWYKEFTEKQLANKYFLRLYIYKWFLIELRQIKDNKHHQQKEQKKQITLKDG